MNLLFAEALQAYIFADAAACERGHQSTQRVCSIDLFGAVKHKVEREGAAISGWLTCAKLQWEQPDLPIYLVANQASAEKRRFADFVGARRLLARGLGARAVVDELIGAAQTI